MATKKKTKKSQTKSQRTAGKKVAPMKRAIEKKLAKKKVIAKKLAKKKAAPKKAQVKTKGGKMAVQLKKQVREKSQSVDTVAFAPEGVRSGEQSGDLQGLTDVQGADSESVDELLEEGNAFEAEVVHMKCHRTMFPASIWTKAVSERMR
jgi:hypothetical protein